MLCFGGIGEVDWTKKINIGIIIPAFLKHDSICLGYLYFNREHLFQEVSVQGDRSQSIQVRVNRFYSFTATDTFLVHSSCYSLLQGSAALEVYPNQLFKLCQSLQPDRQRNFGQDKAFELSGEMTSLRTSLEH